MIEDLLECLEIPLPVRLIGGEARRLLQLQVSQNAAVARSKDASTAARAALMRRLTAEHGQDEAYVMLDDASCRDVGCITALSALREARSFMDEAEADLDALDIMAGMLSGRTDARRSNRWLEGEY